MTKIQVNSQGKAYLTTAGKALVSTQPTLVTKSITENGIYNASSDNADGYSSVTVNVSGGGSTKYGASIDTLLGDIDANGMLQKPSTATFDLDLSGMEYIQEYCLAYKYYKNIGIRNVDMSNLKSIPDWSLCYCFTDSTIESANLSSVTTITGSNACSGVFSSNNNQTANLISIDLSSLETVSGSSACDTMLSGQINLPSTFNSLPKLKEITGTLAMRYFLGGRWGKTQNITTFSFPLLDIITGAMCMTNFFAYRTGLQHIYFNSVNTTSFGSNINQFIELVSNITGCTIHFPSNMQTVISNLTGYPLFGGTDTILAFDLPATS